MSPLEQCIRSWAWDALGNFALRRKSADVTIAEHFGGNIAFLLRFKWYLEWHLKLENCRKVVLTI